MSREEILRVVRELIAQCEAVGCGLSEADIVDFCSQSLANEKQAQMRNKLPFEPRKLFEIREYLLNPGVENEEGTVSKAEGQSGVTVSGAGAVRKRARKGKEVS